MRRRSVFAIALALLPLAALAQTPAAIDTTAFNALSWREIGPYRGGRSAAVTGSVARPNEYYMGTTGGGVFKTIDGGLNWRPTSDAFFGGTVGAIAVSESNPDIVYVGTGEGPIRGNVSHGDGVYRSHDGGKTWTYIGLAETRQISRVRINPKNPDEVYVAAEGHVWAPNPDRGVYRTTDGGKNWKKILFRNDSTGVTDLAMDPADPKVLYAAFWQAGRKPWMLSSGGAGSGIFKTVDGGDNWTEITRNPGTAEGDHREHRHRRVGGDAVARLGAHRDRLGRRVPVGRRGRDVDAHELRAQAAPARVVLHAHLRRSEGLAHRVCASTRPSIGRATAAGRSAACATRTATITTCGSPPDNPQRMIDSNDGGANVEHQRRQVVDGADLRDGAVLSREHHDGLSVLGVRRAAGQHESLRAERQSRRHPHGDWKNGGGCESGYVGVAPRPAEHRLRRLLRRVHQPHRSPHRLREG